MDSTKTEHTRIQIEIIVDCDMVKKKSGAI